MLLLGLFLREVDGWWILVLWRGIYPLFISYKDTWLTKRGLPVKHRCFADVGFKEDTAIQRISSKMGQTNNTQYLSNCSLKQKPTDQPTISSVELYHNCRAKLFPFDIVIPSVTDWSAAFGFNNTVSFILSSNPLRCGSVQPLWYRAQDHPSSADSLLPLCLQQWPGWTYNFGRPTRT